jgi:hypothetical protein
MRTAAPTRMRGHPKRRAARAGAPSTPFSRRSYWAVRGDDGRIEFWRRLSVVEGGRRLLDELCAEEEGGPAVAARVFSRMRMRMRSATTARRCRVACGKSTPTRRALQLDFSREFASVTAATYPFRPFPSRLIFAPTSAHALPEPTPHVPDVRLALCLVVAGVPAAVAAVVEHDPGAIAFAAPLPLRSMSARAQARPRLSTTRRPSSAIFLPDQPGYSQSPPALPEPPRTPSPEDAESSNGSGLPSPPATTSGGSTGDDTTTAGSVRIRNASLSLANPVPLAAPKPETSRMVDFESTYASTSGTGSSSDDPEEDQDDDGEHTARFQLDRRRSMPLTNDRVAALGRLSNLNQRSRDVSFLQRIHPPPVSDT